MIIPPFNNFLVEVGTKDYPHGQSKLYDHLVGTWTILKELKCSENICNAGLFHSIYGTQIFEARMIPIHRREIVKDLIGELSENLVFLFHITPPDRFESFVTMSEPIRSELMTIEYANGKEQFGKDWDDLRLHPYLSKQ